MVVLDKTRLTGRLPTKNPSLRGDFCVKKYHLAGKWYFRNKGDYLVAAATIALNAAGSFTARSARTLRSSSMFAALRPAISLP